jgi:ectoine hydroxylase-related dioxygenase (phytanoyl-CoA dioxygenase family)
MSPPTPQITIVELDTIETSTQRIKPQNLEKAISALHHDGIVVLANAIDPTHLDKLNARMVPEAELLYNRSETHRNFGAHTGNIQQEPVCAKEYIFSDIIANPFATAVIECMLGPNPKMRFYSANTAFKATARQPVHIDVDFDMPSVPFAFCVNVNLVETSEENGATEVWLGSHAGTTRDVIDRGSEYEGVKEELLEERRRISPGIQPGLPKGALIIRDLRLWHAGMPNRTNEPRVMLVSIQFASWYRNEQRFRLPRSLEGKIDWGRLVPCVEWVDDGFDYLQGAHDHDFAPLP